MAAGFYGEIVIRITADTAGLQRGMGSAAAQTEAGAQKIGAAAKKTGAHWERAGLAMQNMGRTMTQFVTLPIAAGFAVATVAGYRYEKTLLKLKNLTGLTAAQTAKYGEAMKELGPAVGVGPQALAEAMYFVTSSGFKAAEALKVVTLSAKASASGMGDVQVITDAVTSAMNSFGHENLSAARAIDIMMKTIQVGKAEPEALATSLGRIMPVAAQLGVEFNQLGGMIAGLTLGGLSAAEAVTSLRGSMFALVAPGKQAAKEMAHWGLSVSQIKRIVRDEGLLEALQLMYEKTGGNELAMKRMIPNVRALNGVLSMLGPNFENTKRTIDEVTNSQGKLNEAFEETKKTAVFRMDQAIASIKSSFTDIGQKILPAMAGLAETAADLAGSFSNLAPSTQKWVLQLAAATAVIGPLSMFAGSMVRTAALIKMAFGGSAAAGGLASMAKWVPKVAIIAAVAYAVFQGVKQGMEQWRSDTTIGKSFWEKLFSSGKAFRQGMADTLGIPKGGVEAIPAAVVAEIAAWRDRGTKLQQIIADANAKIESMLTSHQTKLQLQAQYFKVNFTKAMEIPEVAKAMKLSIDTDIPKKKLMELRALIISSLHVPAKEATALMRMMFPKDWGAVVPKTLGDIDRLLTKAKTRAAEFKKRMDEAMIFEDKGSVKKWAAKFNKVTQEVEQLSQQRARKLAKILGEDIPTKAAAGIGQHGPKLSKRMKLLIDTGILLPFVAAEKKAEKSGTTIGEKVGGGLGKFVRRAGKIAADIVTAVVDPLVASGFAAATAGSLAGSSYVSSLASQEGPAFDAGFLVGSAGVRGINAGQDSESPSKKAIQSGIWLIEGYMVGIKKGTPKAIAAAAEVASNVASILDSALQIGADIQGFKEQGLPSVRVAKAWAARVSRLVKAIYNAIVKELGSLDLLDKETKDKTIPGKGTKFTAIATLAGDIGGIFSAFTDMSVESVTKSMAALVVVRRNAKAIGRNVAAMARAMLRAMDGLFVSEFTGSNISRAVQIASDIASVISTFSEMTQRKVSDALPGLTSVAIAAKNIGWMVRLIATRIKDAFSKANTDEKIAAAVSEAVQLATDIAGIITTFAELTQEKTDLAIAGMKVLLFGGTGVNNIARLSSYLRQIGTVVKLSFAGAAEDLVVSGAASEAVQLATDIAGIITSFAEITETAVTNAKAGAIRVIQYAPELAGKLRDLVTAIAGTFKIISENKDFDPASKIASGVASFVGDITSIISSLSGMYSEETNSETGAITIIDLVDKAITGIDFITNGISNGLVSALQGMVKALTDALGIAGFSLADLTKLSDVLTKLGEIASSITGIVDTLANMSAAQVDAATTAGSSLGEGFYAGLLAQYYRIIDLAKATARDAALALAGLPPLGPAVVGPGGAQNQTATAAPYATSSGGASGNRVENITINQNIGTVVAATPQQASQFQGESANAIITRLAQARRATSRGSGQ